MLETPGGTAESKSNRDVQTSGAPCATSSDHQTMHSMLYTCICTNHTKCRQNRRHGYDGTRLRTLSRHLHSADARTRGYAKTSDACRVPRPVSRSKLERRACSVGYEGLPLDLETVSLRVDQQAEDAVARYVARAEQWLVPACMPPASAPTCSIASSQQRQNIRSRNIRSRLRIFASMPCNKSTSRLQSVAAAPTPDRSALLSSWVI